MVVYFVSACKLKREMTSPSNLTHFILYILLLGTIIHRHRLHFHCYVDDIYMSTTCVTSSTFSNCLCETKPWMQTNYLKMDYDKLTIIPPDVTAATASSIGHCPNSSINFRSSRTLLPIFSCTFMNTLTSSVLQHPKWLLITQCRFENPSPHLHSSPSPGS